MARELASIIEEHIHALSKKFGRELHRDGFRPAIREDLEENRDIVAAVYALQCLFENLEPFALHCVLSGQFDLERAYQISFGPLQNINEPEKVRAAVRRLFGAGVFTEQTQQNLGAVILSDLKRINDGRLLGAHTVAKMAYVQGIAEKPLKDLAPDAIEQTTLDLQRRTIELLERQAVRLARTTEDTAEVRRMIDKIASDFLLRSLLSLYEDYPQFHGDERAFFAVLADKIAQLLANHLRARPETCPKELEGLHFLVGRGIETAYCPRDRRFLLSGDHYGECTANRVRSQVDPEIANIHWAPYSWLLDPFYRVIEVFHDGQNVVKGHVLPLIVHRRTTLMLDAIEVVPELRDRIKGAPNPHRSETLYAHRRELIRTLFEATAHMAARMGIDAVYVHPFSNCDWVRASVAALPNDSFHIAEVEKPFGLEPIARNIEAITGLRPRGLVEEIQAQNPTLMHQYLRAGYLEVGVLRGRRDDYRVEVRGI